MSHAIPLRNVNITCTAGILYPWRRTRSACLCTLSKKVTSTVGNPSLASQHLPSMITSSTVNTARQVLHSTIRMLLSAVMLKQARPVQCVPRLTLSNNGRRTQMIILRRLNHGYLCLLRRDQQRKMTQRRRTKTKNQMVWIKHMSVTQGITIGNVSFTTCRIVRPNSLLRTSSSRYHADAQ